MPDTTPERPVIGVRVHFNDGRAPVLHSNARQFREDETSGVLRVYAGSKQIAVHASMEWAWAELVHGEPAPPPPPPTITTPKIETLRVTWDPHTAKFTAVDSDPNVSAWADDLDKADRQTRIEQARDMVDVAIQGVADACDALGAAMQAAKDDAA